jgi:hypothetical protein
VIGIPSKLVKINQLLIITTVILGIFISKFLLLLPIVIGIITIVTRKNPIITFTFMFIRKDISSYKLEDKDQQIFNQWIATVLISLQFICYVLSLEKIGFFLGVVVITACSFALVGFCIGCVVRYKFIKWKYKKDNKSFNQGEH